MTILPRRMTCGAIAILALAASPQVPVTAQGSGESAAALLHALELDLREASGLATGIQDLALRTRLEVVLVRIERHRIALSRQVGGGAPLPAPPLPPTVSEADLVRFLRALGAAGFDDRRLPLLKDFVTRHRPTCEQGVRLVKMFAFSDGRVEAAVALHPRLADPANFFQVLAALNYDSERDRVRQRLSLPQ